MIFNRLASSSKLRMYSQPKDQATVAVKVVVDSLSCISTKQQTLSWLAELPEDSSAWRELHDDARLIQDIVDAEEDMRNWLERSLSEARELLEQKWTQRRFSSA